MNWKKVTFAESINYWNITSGWSLHNPSFYAELIKVMPIEFWVCEAGVLPLYKNGNIYNSVPDVCSYVCVDAPIKNLAQALKTFPHSIGFIGCYHKRIGEFTPEEVSYNDIITFPLENDFFKYFATLRGKHRKELERVEKLNLHHVVRKRETRVVKGVSYNNMKVGLSWFLEKWEGNEADEEDVIYRRWWINHAKMIEALCTLPSAFIISLFIGEEFVGFNVSERRDNILYDLFSARNPAYDRDLNLGKFITTENIKVAIKAGITEYDMGIHFDYKDLWVPEYTEMKAAPNMLCLHSADGEYTDIEPPYFIDNNLKLDDE